MTEPAAETRFTRRQMLRLSAGALFGLGPWPGALSAAGRRASSDFQFVVINDIHYFDEPPEQWLARIIVRIKGHPGPIDFCFIAGDLAERGRSDELATVRDIFKTLRMPVFTVIGNHDYCSPID